MHTVWLGIFLVSVSSLILLVLRNRTAAAGLVAMGIHVVAAAVLLYVINGLGEAADFHIPINIPTMAAIGVLGIPGLLMLVALKLTVI